MNDHGPWWALLLTELVAVFVVVVGAVTAAKAWRNWRHFFRIWRLPLLESISDQALRTHGQPWANLRSWPQPSGGNDGGSFTETRWLAYAGLAWRRGDTFTWTGQMLLGTGGAALGATLSGAINAALGGVGTVNGWGYGVDAALLTALGGLRLQMSGSRKYRLAAAYEEAADRAHESGEVENAVSASQADEATPATPTRPHHALWLAWQAAVAFVARRESYPTVAGVTVATFTTSLVAGGRRHGRAAMNLWRVWPWWTFPVVLLIGVPVVAATPLLIAPLTPVVGVNTAAAGVVLPVLVVTWGVGAAAVRALYGWRGVPEGARMVGNLASTGPPGTERELMTAVCDEADRRGWTLAGQVRTDRPQLLDLYRTFGARERTRSRDGRNAIMVRHPSSPTNNPRGETH